MAYLLTFCELGKGSAAAFVIQGFILGEVFDEGNRLWRDDVSFKEEGETKVRKTRTSS